MTISVLIVEDQLPLRRILERTFPGPLFESRSVADGLSGVAMAMEMRPDAIILDMMLPGLSGLDVCREIRASAIRDTTRILILSARTQQADRSAAIAAGADLFFAKPFEIPVLRETVIRLAQGTPCSDPN